MRWQWRARCFYKNHLWGVSYSKTLKLLFDLWNHLKLNYFLSFFCYVFHEGLNLKMTQHQSEFKFQFLLIFYFLCHQIQMIYKIITCVICQITSSNRKLSQKLFIQVSTNYKLSLAFTTSWYISEYWSHQFFFW